MERNTQEHVDNAKDSARAAGENMKEAAKDAKRNLDRNALTTKQKVIMAFGMVASAAAGGGIGYVVGRRKGKGGDKNETKELE